MKKSEKKIIKRLLVWLLILILALAVLDRGCALVKRVVGIADEYVQEVRYDS